MEVLIKNIAPAMLVWGAMTFMVGFYIGKSGVRTWYEGRLEDAREKYEHELWKRDQPKTPVPSGEKTGGRR